MARITAIFNVLLFSTLLGSTLLTTTVNAQNEVAFGSATTKSNAILWLNGNGSQGLILPTVTNKSAVSNPDAGMIVYDNSDNKVWYRNNNAWVEVGGGSSTPTALNLQLSGNQLQLRDGTSVLNSVNIAGGTPTAGAFLVFQGGTWQFATLSGDVTGVNGTITITNNAVTSAKLADNAVTSTKIADATIIGADIANTTITPNKLAQGGATDNQVLQWNGTAWVPATLATGGTVTNISGTAPVTIVNPTTTPTISIANAGITNTHIADNAINSAKIQDGTITGADITNTTISADKLSSSGATLGQVLKWNGTAWAPQIDDTGVGTTPTLSNGQLLIGNGTSNSAATLNGDATLSGGTLTISSGAITSAKIADGTITAIDVANTSLTSDKLAQSGASANQVLQWNGSNWVPATLAGGGTVTQINTGTGLTGGPINNTGTISIAAGGVGTTELANSAVDPTKLADNAVTTAKINASAVDATKLADNAVTSAKIADATITGADIAATTITGGNIAITTITADKLAQSSAAAGQVLKWNGTNWMPQDDDTGVGTTPTLSNGQILIGNGTTNSPATLSGDATLSGGALTIGNNAITTAKINAGAVDATKLADNAVTSAKILDATITGADIGATTITGGNIANTSVTADKLAQSGAANNQVLQWNGTNWVPVTLASGGTVTQINTGTGLTGGPISNTGTISIAAGGVGTTELSNSAVDATKLADNAVTTLKVADNAITSNKIADASITGADISATTITADKLAQSGANTNEVLQWNGTNWIPTTLTNSSGWTLTGNTGTNPSTNFIGTTDALPLRFSTNTDGGGGERMRIDATGKVGIGTTTPSSSFDVISTITAIKAATNSSNIGEYAISAVHSGTGDAAGFFVNTNSANSETALYSASSGTNGYGFYTETFGTNAVALAASINASGTGKAAKFDNYNNGNASTVVEINNAGAGPSLVVTTGNVGIGVSTPTTKLHVTGQVRIADGTEGANKVLTSDALGNASWQSAGGAGFSTLNILPKGDGTGLVASQIFDNGTQIGIGTNSPSNFFHIAGDVGGASTIATLEGHSATASRGPGISLLRSKGTVASPTAVSDGDYLGGFSVSGRTASAYNLSSNIQFSVDGTVSGTSVPGRITFSTTLAGNSTFTERMRITNAGNVGIGTTSPTERLHVLGNILFSGALLSSASPLNFRVAGIAAGQVSSGGPTFLGYQAGASNTYFTSTGVGYRALFAQTSAPYNTAVGYSALASTTTGGYNTAVGEQALTATTGTSNTGIGRAALYANVGGSQNTGVGTSALINTTASNGNVAIGYNAGYQFNYGYNNTFLGANTNGNAAGQFNLILIGQGAVGTASNQVTIGNSANNSYRIYGTWSNISDGRFKKNIKTETVKGLDFIMKLRPVTYNLTAADLHQYLNTKGRSITLEMDKYTQNGLDEREKEVLSGFIAQEVEQAAKEAGYDFSGIEKPVDDNDTYGLKYAEFVVPLVKAVQEQQAIIEKLKVENASYLREVEKLSSDNEIYRSKVEKLADEIDLIKGMLGMMAKKE